MSVSAQLPPVLERHELKYLIPWSYVEPISRFIAPFCLLDTHSAQAPEHFYVVNSLYFDTRGLEFLKQRLYGKDSRFNMRVRSYGTGDQPPYYMEIKHKVSATVKKYRATVSGEDWPRILTDPGFRIAEDEPIKERRNKELFLRLATSYAIEPKILTQYRRRAFFSVVDEYARVTMDASMKYRLQNDHRLQPDGDMLLYDNETIYATNEPSDAAVVLELKSNIGQVPSWMLDLIRFFELRQRGFSKYLSSTLVSHLDNGFSYMNADRRAGVYAWA